MNKWTICNLRVVRNKAYNCCTCSSCEQRGWNWFLDSLALLHHGSWWSPWTRRIQKRWWQSWWRYGWLFSPGWNFVVPRWWCFKLPSESVFSQSLPGISLPGLASTDFCSEQLRQFSPICQVEAIADGGKFKFWRLKHSVFLQIQKWSKECNCELLKIYLKARHKFNAS